MNVENMRKVRDGLKSLVADERFQMDALLYFNVDSNRYLGRATWDDQNVTHVTAALAELFAPTCRAAACIAGFTVALLSPGRDSGWLVGMLDDERVDAVDLIVAAQDLLGLNHFEADDLFNGRWWDELQSGQVEHHLRSVTREMAIEQLTAMIDHFEETGEVRV